MAAITSLTESAILALINNGTWPIDFPVASGVVGAVVNDALTVDVSKASSLLLHVKNTGTATMAAGTFQFEASIDSTNGIDGTWFSVQAGRTNANTIETSASNLGLAAAAGMVCGWRLNALGWKWFRIRSSVITTASSVATWTIQRGAYSAEPVPTVQPHGITGAVSVTAATGTNYVLISAANTNPASVKSSAGNLFEITAFNPTAAVIYVKLYNKASAPTVGTDVPIYTLAVPVNGDVQKDFGALGKRFSAGIAIAVTAGPLATDNVAVAIGAQISATYV